MATTVPAAKAALLAVLQAREDLAGVLVQRGLPAEVPAQKERVYLSGTEALTRDPVLQQGLRRESYLLPLVIEVERFGRGDQVRDGVEQRGWDIVDELEAAIAEDPELGGILDDAELEGVPVEVTLPLTGNDGWLTRITAQVRARAFV